MYIIIAKDVNLLNTLLSYHFVTYIFFTCTILSHSGNVIDVIDENAPKKGKKSNRSEAEEAALAKRRKRDNDRKMKKKAAEATKSSGGNRKKGVGSDDEDSGNDDVEQVVHTPKIRIKISSDKKTAKGINTKQGSKRKATPKKSEIGNRAKKAKLSNSVVKAPPPSSSDGSDDEEEEVEMKLDEMFDFARLQSQYVKLNATSWEEAYNFSTKLGPWRLPADIESKFKDVAKITLSLMSKYVYCLVMFSPGVTYLTQIFC